jgi:hypothetical protein
MAAGDPGTLKRNYSAIAVETTLTAALASQAQGDANTSFVIASVSGFPSSFPYTLLVDPDTNKEEVVTVYGGSGTTLQVYRGQDNTQAVAHSAGATIRHGISAREFKELQTHIAARGFASDSGILNNVDTHVHGIATGEGDVVGTLKTQTLASKTLTSPLVSGLTLTDASIVFEGATADAFETTLTVTDPTSDRTITLPNVTGTVAILDAAQTLSNKTLTSDTLGSDLAAGGFKVTGLGTPSSTADAATKGYVDTQVSSLVDSAPGTLDTLNELAAALGDDPNFATTITNSLAGKLSLTGGTMTGAIAMGTNKITGLGTPTASTDAANKDYIDTMATSAGASATAAALSASSAATSATSAASSATAANSSFVAVTGLTGAGLVRDMGEITVTDTTSTTYVNIATVSAAAASSASAAATSASSAATSASSAATSASDANTSANNASASSSQAAVSASSAATSATAAATSATSAAASATTASNSAATASTSAGQAATSATSSAASATLANDWATLTSGPVAGGEYSAKYHSQLSATSATASASSASAAATSATSAAASATAAATSATSASASATAAATSATSAAASATAAAGYIPTISAGVNGYFLTNNGTSASWANLSDWGTI